MPQPARLANAAPSVLYFGAAYLHFPAGHADPTPDRTRVQRQTDLVDSKGISMRSRIDRCAARLGTLVVASMISGLPAFAQYARAPIDEAVLVVLGRLSIDLPSNVATSEPVKSPIEALSREPCDQQAIEELGDALQKVGRRREAATAHISFSATCPGHHAPSLRTAINILLTLSDYSGAISVASNLIALEPYEDNGYYLRAVARDRAGQLKPAIDDYVTAIELFGDKDRISSVSYLAMARAYERLGRFCDAVSPIETWISLNPARNDTSQTRAIIADYTGKGRCQSSATGSEEVFKVGRQGTVVKLKVSINGVPGTLVLDTGASFVSLTAAFAQKAKVQVDQDSTVQIHTANGIGNGKQGRAATIQLRSLAAKDVPILVQADAKAAYGDGVDGLLGMSFLSHFKVSIDTQAVRISSRKTN